MPAFFIWLIIILDFIVPFVPIMAIFLVYVLIAKPVFFKNWIDKIYAQPVKPSRPACRQAGR